MHIHLHFSWSPSRTSRARSAARMGVLALLLALLIVLLVGDKPKATRKPTGKRDKPSTSKARTAPHNDRKHAGKARADLDAMQARFAETDRKIREHFEGMREDAMEEARQFEAAVEEEQKRMGWLIEATDYTVE